MTADELNSLLKNHDLGDDFFERNLLLDTEFSSLSRADFESMRIYANNKMAWYWTDQDKHYLLADCNRFHFMWLGHGQEWCTKHDIGNPAIGRAYGLWVGQPHMWAWAVVNNVLIFVNWGKEEQPLKYSGKGSVAV